MKIPGIMIAAPMSGCGKTTVACGLMQVLKSRGYKIAGAKCGPDYIDPMFHREVLGIDSQNLDLFFCEQEVMKRLFEEHAKEADVAVIEGVMGYYDGMALDSGKASSYETAKALHIPVILVVNCKGAALSVLALLKGFLTFREDHQIEGIILNRTSKAVYPRMKKMIEQGLLDMGYPVPVVGYVPDHPAFQIESRHLGLVTPEELQNLQERFAKIGQVLEETADVGALLRIAGAADKMGPAKTLPETSKGMPGAERATPETSESTPGAERVMPETSKGMPGTERAIPETSKGMPGAERTMPETSERMPERAEQARILNRPRLAVARDPAFGFYYKDNLRLLEKLGCELVPFSPLADEKLPDDISGLLLGGGYPELYARELSENIRLKRQIRTLLDKGLPCHAECGGFMYLHETMEGMDGEEYEMAGFIEGAAVRKDRLVRFGYIEIEGVRDGAYLDQGEVLRGHEFHYWDSANNGADCTARKPGRDITWNCIHMKGNVFAGFPHIHYYSNVRFAQRFVERMKEYTRCNNRRDTEKG